MKVEVVVKEHTFGEPPKSLMCSTNPVVNAFLCSSVIGKVASQAGELFHSLKDLINGSQEGINCVQGS